MRDVGMKEGSAKAQQEREREREREKKMFSQVVPSVYLF